MKNIKLPLDFQADKKSHIRDLNNALGKLKLLPAEMAADVPKMDADTVKAIKKIQKENKLPVDGKVTAETLGVINLELEHRFIADNKYRTAEIHSLFKKLNLKVDDADVNQRKAGASTVKAIEDFQKEKGMPVTGKISGEFMDNLHDAVIKETYKTRNQKGNLLKTLQQVNAIAKLNTDIAPEEFKQKILGPTSNNLIRAFQEKYKLPVTGEINKATLDKLNSVASSKGTYSKRLKAPTVDKLKTVSTPLRLNMVSPEVAEMQKSLSFLGYKISEKEFNTQAFGKTTIKAVKKLQQAKGLPQTGHFDKATSKEVNKLLVAANPGADSQHRYRIRGSVRDELWQRKNNMVVKIFEKILDTESAEPLGAKKNFLNGFFDIPYNAPINSVNGQVKENFHLVVKLYTADDQKNPVAVQTHYNVNQIHWVNFTGNMNEAGNVEYSGKYAGESDFEVTGAILQKALGNKKVEDIKETDTDKQISQLSLQTGLSTDDIMRHVLSRLVEKSVNSPAVLTAEVFYAFIRQNLPPGLPSDLLRGASEWETIDHFTELAASGIIFLDDSSQLLAIENAAGQNLVSQKVNINKDAILQALKTKRGDFALTKPILVGNGNLKSLLDESKIDAAHYNTVASAFLNNRGVNTAFWEEMKKHEQAIGADAITDFANTIEIGNITKNHIETVTFLKNQIGNAGSKPFRRASDIAKLDQAGLENLLSQNGNQVPDNMPGGTPAERVANFAAAIKARTEFLFPAVSLVAEIKRINTPMLTRVTEVQNFIDEQTELKFREQNIDKYLLDKNINLDSKVKEEVKLVQRVHKLTTNTAAGTALIDEGLHSSMQIYFKGKEPFADLMKARGVDEKQIHLMYESSKMQYMQILGRLTDYRRELYRDLPRVITSHVYTKKEIQEVLGDIPNLETLFGSLDYCDCEHCKSLYGPAAYFTDMLRFLKEHNSLIKQGGKTLTVKDILFLRRPDLGNIKLNCENTNTPLPYIDLVCEILENNIAPQQKNFSYQTTLSQKELRAIPQHIRPHAYTVLATADFPMYSSFNLGQEEARTYLNFLRVPRYELMEAFQDKSDTNNKMPDDVSIATEYFSISSKEKDLIVTQRQTAVEQNKYWGFATTQSSVAVSLFMKRTKLSYYELLELLLVKFVNDPAVPPVSKIERPLDTCDTEQQTVSNLSVSKFDLMHRFIRLWRKTGWKMWELDLLIRNEKINPKVNNVVEINGGTLVNLKRFKQLQEKLRLPFETLLAFYGEINREIRINPEKSDVIIQPLYNKLFQSLAVTNPLDSYFQAIDNTNAPVNLDAAIVLGVNPGAPYNGYSPVPTILSALALQQSDFDLLVNKTDNHLSVSSLSTLLRNAYLARSLKLSVKDLLLLLGITNVADPFSSLQTTLDCIKYLEHITASGLNLRELDYILNYSPESPIGLREEALSQIITALRNILETNKEKIERLKLSLANRTTILAFDAATLLPMATKALIDAALAPLKTILISSIENFTAAAFSVQETNAIIHFDSNSLTDASKANLIENIKALQLNLTNLLNQNKNQIKSQVAASFGVTDEQASVVLERVSVVPGPVTILQKLEDESLLAKKADGSYREINLANFSEHFATYALLHKIAILISKMRIETKDLEWFIVNRTDVDTLDFSALPVSAAVNPNDFGKWYNLYRFLNFKSKFPEPENASIRSILDLARKIASSKAAIIAEIAKLTQWETTGLNLLCSDLKIKHGIENGIEYLDYTKAENYHRLFKCFEQMKLTGVGAATMFNWAKVAANPATDLTIAAQTRLAVKSKYEQDDWLQKVTPLQDDIREKKRMALVEYHLENSQRNEDPEIKDGVITNPLYWRDANALYKYFLIDVEMSACQLTSRIKQALSSVQLFVQRCFLNLENRYVEVTQDEKDDKSSPNAWSQWRWMKNYRIWEANRKIFFYPENWLEPELRDDKSPFFKELENELMQNEITRENVEEAFKNYLYKVDEVSHLEVCGLYHQMEDLDPGEIGYETNVVHVIGRTKTIPHIYYYRTYDMNYNTWAAWEKVDVDITGDQVVPVVYNRKLHLFWLQFMEKPMKAKKVPAAQPTNGPTTSPEPMKVLEIQLGWSIKKSGGWTPKKISKQKLIHPWERPHHTYNLKPYYLAKFNELYLDIYLSTSQEFNDSKFYDPFKALAENPVYLTKNRFNETYLPWHSSAFVFNGDVKEIKLKGLGGHFHFEFSAFGQQIVNIDQWLPSDSYTYVHENFGADGAAIKELDPEFEYGPRLRLPDGMHFENTHLKNNRKQSKNDKYLKVLENTNSVTLLEKAISPFELVITQQDLQFNTLTNHPMFYQDDQRAFFVKPEWKTLLGNYGQSLGTEHKFRFTPFYHPYTVLFIRELNRDGIDGLLNRRIQIKPESFPPKNNFNFDSYSPNNSVVIVGGEEDSTQKKTDIVDFSFSGAYSIYNWELFFHAPLMVACRLMQNQKFEDAMYWFHYIFNPTDIEKYDIPQRYWVTKPFFNYNSNDYRKQRIESILSDINQEDNREQLKAWRNNPFKPHVVARHRPVAYQKNVVMKYLDNLIAWGDMLFKRDTIESINEASLLYMLAYEILGDRPQKVPNVKHEELTFNELEPKLDEFGNARVDVVIEDTLLPITVVPTSAGAEPIPKLETFYFCIPHNDYLTKYWDTVEDRLFKIRHCMNIEGIVRQLPLFEPPIDPALLVKAAAAGIDFGSVLNDLSAPTPYYRFRIVVQKAIDFCNEVKILGEKLLSALEKKDVEHLSLLRSQYEIQLLEAVKEVRKKQIDEAVETIGSLNKAFEMAEERKSYYEGKPDLVNVAEGFALGFSTASLLTDVGIAIMYGLAGGFKAIPNFKVGGAGFGGTPSAHVETGGGSIGGALEMAARTLQSVATSLDKAAALSSTIGSYQHRKDDWNFQGRIATIEKEQIQFQINAAQIRQAIAEKELENQELQIDNTKTVDDYMRNKYSNEQLYNWMITQISTVYFQAYQLAYDMAKKAEKCYQYELGITDSNIIQFGYWDSLKKGLLSGDKLMNDLRRLEAEYINQNRREFEITKHFSLAQMAPNRLIELKETGKCIVSLPEWLFDMDYPGHYMRRIKSVSISIPCIVGPYTGINCMLSLLGNETRMEATLSGGKYEKQGDDTRFKTMFGAISSIATSHAQNDSGMFELNFYDERYLPFEGAGAISDWEISMPIENNYFDFASLSDVILQISYTSRNGGGQFATEAHKYTQGILPNEAKRLFSLKHEFPSEWYRFFNPEGAGDQEFVVNLKPDHYPFYVRQKLNTLKITKMDLFVETNLTGNFSFSTILKMTNTAATNELPVDRNPKFNNVHQLSREFTQGSLPNTLGEIRLKKKVSTVGDYKSLNNETIENIFILLQLGT